MPTCGKDNCIFCDEGIEHCVCPLGGKHLPLCKFNGQHRVIDPTERKRGPCPVCGRPDVLLWEKQEGTVLTFHDNKSGKSCPGGGK